jgi:FMN-dependent NADH-azoreductase
VDHDHRPHRPEAEVTTRDLADGMPLIDEAWVAANFTPADDRTEAQRDVLALSDELVAELRAADTLVIGLPIYNFGVPASFKAWVDLVARAGVTFQYSETGPRGLLEGKRAIVAVASGGVEAGSEIDFATGYVRHSSASSGSRTWTFVTADRLMLDAKAPWKRHWSRSRPCPRPPDTSVGPVPLPGPLARRRASD